METADVLSRMQTLISPKELRRYDSVPKEAQPAAGSTAAPRSIAHDCRDDRLRVLVRVLARQAAGERFEREVAAERGTQPEVTLH